MSYISECRPVPEAAHPSIQYAAYLAANLIAACNFDVPTWEVALVPYFEIVTASPSLLPLPGNNNDEQEGEDLCNCRLLLTYGAKILLNTANLRLKCSHRYGLCGCHGSGKSTLMHAITNGQAEGFPPPNEACTFYIEHDIDGSDEETSVLQFILNDKRILCDKKEVVETLPRLRPAL
ncbi:unnamed protein product [Rhizoctonia solani]|uniref:ABC transporter domain-containing protein n=1 Tax=Rhizoctonia solani TaxID=456999 RepID=A0A8H3CIA6_9AGAM|nr:unnamed protein product [Rhizoctonia solani]CAE6531516.1 unnamed protein product [Rhizoctonia solani]